MSLSGGGSNGGGAWRELRALLVLATPVIVQSLLHTLVFLTDRAMLGRHGGAALGSMQISGPVVWSTYSVLGAFTAGTVALVGRAVGQGDRALAGSAARASLAAAACIGTAAAALGLLLLEPILAWFGAAGPEVQAEARGFLRVVLPAMPFILVSLGASAVLQAAGDTRTPLWAAVAANLVNVALNYVFIFGHLGAPRLGALGAGIGSAAAMLVSSMLLLGVLASGSGAVTTRGRGGERAAWQRILSVSRASFLERGVQHVGFQGYVAMIAGLGPLAMAANQALVSIESVCFLTADGLGIAAAARVAQGLGQGRPDRAATTVWLAALVGALTLGGVGAAFAVFPAPLLGAFSSDPGILEVGIPCMYVAAVAQPVMAVGIILADSLRGAGDTRAVMVSMFVGGMCVRLACSWIAAFELGFGLAGIWIGSTCDWLVRAVILSIRFHRGRWREIRV